MNVPNMKKEKANIGKEEISEYVQESIWEFLVFLARCPDLNISNQWRVVGKIGEHACFHPTVR